MGKYYGFNWPQGDSHGGDDLDVSALVGVIAFFGIAIFLGFGLATGSTARGHVSSEGKLLGVYVFYLLFFSILATDFRKVGLIMVFILSALMAFASAVAFCLTMVQEQEKILVIMSFVLCCYSLVVASSSAWMLRHSNA